MMIVCLWYHEHSLNNISIDQYLILLLNIVEKAKEKISKKSLQILFDKLFPRFHNFVLSSRIFIHCFL
jgi:hypothetical protein